MPNLTTNHAYPSVETPLSQWQSVETVFFLAGFALMVAAIVASLVIVGFIAYVLGDVLLHVGSPHWNGFHLPWK